MTVNFSEMRSAANNCDWQDAIKKQKEYIEEQTANYIYGVAKANGQLKPVVRIDGSSYNDNTPVTETIDLDSLFPRWLWQHVKDPTIPHIPKFFDRRDQTESGIWGPRFLVYENRPWVPNIVYMECVFTHHPKDEKYRNLKSAHCLMTRCIEMDTIDWYRFVEGVLDSLFGPKEKSARMARWNSLYEHGDIPSERNKVEDPRFFMRMCEELRHWINHSRYTPSVDDVDGYTDANWPGRYEALTGPKKRTALLASKLNTAAFNKVLQHMHPSEDK
jgi:hypothetical protein